MLRAAVSTAVIAVLVSGLVWSGFAGADQYQEQINQLQAQNNTNRSQSVQLAAIATSYQDAIVKLQAQIENLQQAIVTSQKQSDDLQKQIDAAEAELDHQREVLGKNIKAMYLEGKVSTLEILASSNDLSDYVNKAEYRNSVQSKVKNTLDKINHLKQDLQTKQNELQAVIKDQQNQKSLLVDTQSQQSQMLAYTEGQKAAYDQQIKNNNSEIARLRALQLAANRSLGGAVVPGDPGHGGYPANWDRATQDSMLDSWGMYNRECVSYTAWKVYQTYGYMPYWGGHGNANQWPASAQADGIATGTTPRVGSVAISMSGYYGHAMWVEAVNGNTIYVSQYNYDLQGHYSEMSINGSGLIYIYFGG